MSLIQNYDEYTKLYKKQVKSNENIKSYLIQVSYISSS